MYDIWVERDDEKALFETVIKMERCRGNLEEYLAGLRKSGQQIDPLDLLEIMIQISSGLRHCHDCGICHRDLKPSNGILQHGILLTTSSVYKRDL